MDGFWEKLDTSRTPFFLEEEKVAEGPPSSQAVRVQLCAFNVGAPLCLAMTAFGVLGIGSMLLCCFHVERLLPCRHSDRKYQLF